MKNNNRTIVVNFGDENQYQNIISDRISFLEFVVAYILSLGAQLLHKASCTGSGNCFTRHSHYVRVKCGITIWRIQCKECGAVFTVMPSILIRYFRHRADRVKNALIAYHGGLSFENCSICFDISGMSLYRFICSLGKYPLSHVLYESGLQLPENIWADEKHSKCKGQKGYIPLVSSGHTTWHIDYVESVDDETLHQSYQQFAQETRQIDPDYEPKTINHDGFQSTINALKRCFSGASFLLCWLHAFKSLARLLKILPEDVVFQITANLRQILKRSHSVGLRSVLSLRSSLSQFYWRYVAVLVPANLFDPLKNWIDSRRATFSESMKYPVPLSYGYPIDHICNHLDRKLFMMKHFHHPDADRVSFLKGFALIHNFIPYQRFARNARKCPAEVDGAILPHPDWFVSLLILTAGGYHKIR